MSAPEKLPPRDLSGTWLAAPADEDLRRRYHESSFDDSSWHPAEVPGQWRSVPSLSGSDGPVLFRRRFETTALDQGERAWLVLDGVFYTSDVWLDGTYVGDTEGYFFPHSFDVTGLIGDRTEHLLAVEVACSPPAEEAKGRHVAGFPRHWGPLDPLAGHPNPGGIWRPVRIELTGPVRISHLRVLCRDIEESSATVAVRASLDADEARTVKLRTTIHAPDGRELLELSRDQHLATGPNHLEWAAALPDPQLWWPWALGDQPQYKVSVGVHCEGTPSDLRHRELGLREVALRNWQFSVNGERFFPKGSNLASSLASEAGADVGGSEAEAARRVELAREEGFDLLRVNGYVARPELYEAADRVGMLLWQDLPLQWRLGRTARRQARRQAEEAIDLLAHHPSVAIWGNMATLDRSMTRLLWRADGTRPVVIHSGVLPQPPVFDGSGGSHLLAGRRPGRAHQLKTLLRSPGLRAGDRLDLEVQAVNHRDISFPDIVLRADLQWRRADGEPSKREKRAWKGGMSAGSYALAAVIDSVAPAEARSLRVDLELVGPDEQVLATNTYTASIGAPRGTSRLLHRGRG